MRDYWCIEWHTEIGSTMERAGELASSGEARGIVVVADHQSAGRGTHGRSWVAPPGTCLMFTAVLNPKIEPEDLSDLPAQVGRRVASVLIDRLGLDVTVRYPNDLMIGERKVCGILCQSRVLRGRVTYALCGIGLNTWMREDQLPVPDATSLYLSGGHVPTHEILLEWLLEGLVPLR